MLVTGTHGGADSAPRRKKLPETVLGLELEDRESPAAVARPGSCSHLNPCFLLFSLSDSPAVRPRASLSESL